MGAIGSGMTAPHGVPPAVAPLPPTPLRGRHPGPDRAYGKMTGAVARFPITFAHRGARLVHRENTLAAFRHALERGAKGLETDAWLSGDGEVVLVHDGVVRAFPRRLRVDRTSADRLRKHDVPRLVDLYDELGADYDLSIDLKDAQVGAAILDLARERGSSERTWLCSPSRGRLRELRELDTDVRLVHSTWKDRIKGSMERHAAELAESGIDAMNLHHAEWTAGLVSLFHRFDVRAFAWDTQEVRQLRAMLQFGIDGVYCDDVDRMVAVIAEWQSG
jgi:glycerophosphoryl diester phosphodiesterase